ncbi:hypothetical protein LOD99_6393 [Oopsacas minuta]|uniref:Uncharacterized protein n=1 Tax=Oopsacas minuta TaxID=111878 RepID=A0AAV7JLK8_9METZ|nr:hypothetical protein LOD99_6393 [Oopsacas minuta]
MANFDPSDPTILPQCEGFNISNSELLNQNSLKTTVIDESEVNFMHSGLKHLPDLSQFTQIQILCLRRNEISSIVSIPFLPLLKELDLYDNLLDRIEPLNNVPNLITLDISFNNVRMVENLEPLSLLENLYLIQNKISEIQCLSHLKFLIVLELGANR